MKTLREIGCEARATAWRLCERAGAAIDVAEITLRCAHAAVAGALYDGVQSGFGKTPNNHLFTELTYGSTFAVPIAGATRDAVRRAADEKRDEMSRGGVARLTPDERSAYRVANDQKWKASGSCTWLVAVLFEFTQLLTLG